MKSIVTTLYFFLLLAAFGDLPNLPPGESIFTNGTTFAACPEVGGTILRDQLVPFEVRGNDPNTVLLTGRLQDRVIRNSEGNIVFSSRVRDLVNPNGVAWISRINYHGFKGLTLGADYRTDGLGQIGPRLMLRSSDGDRLTANHGADLIVPTDEQKSVNFVSTETDFGLGGRVEIIVNTDFGGEAFSTTIYGTASRKAPGSALPSAEEIRPSLPQVILNNTIYQDGDAVTAEVHFTNISQIDQKRLVLVFGGPEKDEAELEMVRLISTQDPLVYVTETPLETQKSDQPVQGDQKISLEPGALFVAMLSYEYFSVNQERFDLLASDWGSLLDENPTVGKVEVREGFVLTDDELNPADGAKAIGTLFVEGEVGPVQVASKELLFFPKDQDQLVEFLARTNGFISGFEGHRGGPVQPDTKLPKAGEAWFTISMEGDPSRIPMLPQLRALVGEENTLSVSNPETLALIASAMELWSEGFLVGLNPRMQMHGSLSSLEHLRESGRADSYGLTGNDGNNSPPIQNEVHGMRQSWAFLEMFDFADQAIPVGVIDSGFAPNRDFKTDHPLYSERNLSNNTSGPGSAQTPQEVGNSGFGDKEWHGNGTVTTISGVLGNRFGTAGVAAQTAVPKLYHMGLTNFALGFGTAIEMAVNEGSSVINISAGYPCRILTIFGNDDICAPGGRAALSAKLSLAVRATALAACAAGAVLDLFVPGAGSAVCASAIVAAELASAAIFSSVFLGNTRGPVERGVAYATSRGVPIVASTGNRLSADTVGILAPLINLEDSNLDQWQIIPAVIPDVIAVGACHPTDYNGWDGSGLNFYANLHFWGDSIDIWAPINHHYWAPKSGTADPATVSDDDHILRSFGGTSCAAPVITGVIANMMAIDPSLDRRFATPVSRSSIPGRVRNLLVSHAYQAGDPEAPDSADDRALYERDEDTGVWEEIEIPASLLLEMQRRRNFVNPWRTLREVARSAGLLEYEDLGYHDDLGMDDRYVDVRDEAGFREPVFPNTVSLNDELTAEDEEFFFQVMPVADPDIVTLYRRHFTVTMPRRENGNGFLINNARGSLVSTTVDEQVLSWVSGEYWENSYVPTVISGSDTLYKMTSRLSEREAPPADRFDLGDNENDFFESATPLSDWVSVEDTKGVEAEAWELCLEDLNIHSQGDRDFYRIDFTSELGVPTFCSGSLNPWLTIKVEPHNSAIVVNVFSRTDGEEELLVRGRRGQSEVRLDCAQYAGKLPLYIDVQGYTYLEYDLKLRWSKPDEVFVGTLDDWYTRHSGGQDASEVERYFPPIVPQFLGAYGGAGPIPAEVVNPNPMVFQPVDSQGRYLFARIFEVNVSAGEALNGILAQIPTGESLRMELFDTSGQMMATSGTSDLGFKDDPLAINGEVHSLMVEFPEVKSGTYFLSLSGHRPGDQINLFPSRALLGNAGGISMEDILSGAPGAAPAALPHLTGFGEDSSSSVLSAIFTPGGLDLMKVPSFGYSAKKEEIYRIQLLGEDDIWRYYLLPTLGEGEEVTFVIDSMEKFKDVRVQQLGSDEKVALTSGPTNYQLRYQSIAGVPAGLKWSPNLRDGSWEPLDGDSSFIGDGDLRNWFFEVNGGREKGFFRIEEE